MIKVVSWNIAKRHAPWRELVRMGVDESIFAKSYRNPILSID